MYDAKVPNTPIGLRRYVGCWSF